MDGSPNSRALADLARAYVLHRYGAVALPVRVIVTLDAALDLEGISVELLAPIAPVGRPVGAMHANILEALKEAAVPLTGPKLADAAGYSYGGRFRSAVKELERQGRIRKCEPNGYQIVTE